jgi:Glycosyltransferase like family
VIVVGCCVGPGGRFDRIAGPSLEQVLHPDDELVLVEGAEGICSGYNTVLERARRADGCEGVLLVHDDVELGGPHVRDQLLDAVREPEVGLVGVAGGRGLAWGKWWSGRALAGHAHDARGRRRLGPDSGDVDAVDGLLLFVGPKALHLDFDAETFPAFHGYDVDYSLQVRSEGMRVVVRPVDHRHVDKGSTGDHAAFERAMRSLERKWPQWIRPLTARERLLKRLAPSSPGG